MKATSVHHPQLECLRGGRHKIHPSNHPSYPAASDFYDLFELGVLRLITRAAGFCGMRENTGAGACWSDIPAIGLSNLVAQTCKE